MADAIYGGATIEATQNDMVRQLQSTMKGYQRQLFQDGVYAVVTLMANDDSAAREPLVRKVAEKELLKRRNSEKMLHFLPGKRPCAVI